MSISGLATHGAKLSRDDGLQNRTAPQGSPLLGWRRGRGRGLVPLSSGPARPPRCETSPSARGAAANATCWHWQTAHLGSTMRLAFPAACGVTARRYPDFTRRSPTCSPRNLHRPWAVAAADRGRRRRRSGGKSAFLGNPSEVYVFGAVHVKARIARASIKRALEVSPKADPSLQRATKEPSEQSRR